MPLLLTAITSSPKLSKLHCVISLIKSLAPVDVGWFQPLPPAAHTPAVKEPAPYPKPWLALSVPVPNKKCIVPPPLDDCAALAVVATSIAKVLELITLTA
mgnify:FL=1